MKNEGARVLLENKKLVFQMKGIAKSVCEEAKNQLLEELSEKLPENSAFDFLVSKGAEEEEAKLFIQELKAALLLNLKELLQEFKALEKTTEPESQTNKQE